MEKLNLEWQWAQYLKRVRLDEKTMPTAQLRETKRAFMGACAQIIIMLRDDLSQLDDDTAVAQLEGMKNQATNFWLNETKQQN